MLVVFEGVTRSGKSTACHNVTVLLSARGYNAINLNDLLIQDQVCVAIKGITHPSSSDLSPVEELLLYSTRLARKSHLILDLLRSDPASVVLVDRFNISLIAYFETVLNLPRTAVESIVSLCTHGATPDVTIMLDAPLDVLLSRGLGKSRSRKNQNFESYYEKYHQGMIHEVQKLGPAAIIIDTSMISEEDVATSTVKYLEKIELL